MKERPILFSAPMVRALLEGRKTQTRRVVKIQPPDERYKLCTCISTTGNKRDEGRHHWSLLDGNNMLDGNQPFFSSPYGYEGDLLWVKETFRDARDFGVGRVLYRASGDTSCGWKPSIYMPRGASRIMLEITGVRVERLQDISEADARSEGVYLHDDGRYANYMSQTGYALNARSSFSSLCESINGQGSWEENPWVWVIEFRRIKP